MVVAAMIGASLMKPLETPSAQLSNERVESFESEVLVYVGNEEFFINDFPCSPVRLRTAAKKRLR